MGKVLRFSLDSNIYVWKTEAPRADAWWKLMVKFNDGSEHVAYSRFN